MLGYTARYFQILSRFGTRAGKATEQNSGVGPLLGCKCPLYRAVKVAWPVETGNFSQAGALSLEALLDLRFVFDLDQICGHFFLRRWAVKSGGFPELWLEVVAKVGKECSR